MPLLDFQKPSLASYLIDILMFSQLCPKHLENFYLQLLLFIYPKLLPKEMTYLF